MVNCGAFVVNCVAARGAKFGTKKVTNYFELFFNLSATTDEGGSGSIAPTVR
jgi:hypothetical protein